MPRPALHPGEIWPTSWPSLTSRRPSFRARSTCEKPVKGALTFANVRGGASDLSEFFALRNPALPFTPIKAPLSAQCFLTRTPSNTSVEEFNLEMTCQSGGAWSAAAALTESR
jgi:hypothetical protein